MKLKNVDHVLRAAANICEETDFGVVGSQAIFGQHPDVTDAVVTRSIELDLYPLNAPEKSEMLNAIGVMSKFHNEFGYYADGVGPETVVAPEGWQHRRVALTTRTLQGTEVRGWCLETHDLLISKYVAGRPKDLEYCSAVIRLAKAEKDLLLNRLKVITASDDILSGTPVFAGERVPVRTLIDYIEEGHSIADLLVDFPTVAKDNVIQVLAMLKDDLQRHAARS